MKKLIKTGLVVMSILIICVGIVVASMSKQGETQNYKNNKVSLPSHAVEVAPGLFKVGESVDKHGKIIEDYLFVHYAISKSKKAKVIREDSCYGFIVRGMELSSDHNKYYINPANPQGLGDEFIIPTVNTAISEWEKSENGGYDIFGDYLGRTESGFVMDTKNTLSFGDYSTPGVIAVCRISGYFHAHPKLRKIIEFDVMFDTDFKWGDGEVNSNLMDLQNIATHELGHALGLGDLYNSACSTQTMYGYSYVGDIEKRSLGKGDIAGIKVLYR